jgi:hypothetical protein
MDKKIITTAIIVLILVILGIVLFYYINVPSLSYNSADSSISVNNDGGVNREGSTDSGPNNNANDSSVPKKNTAPTPNQNIAPNYGKGTLYVTITDGAFDMQGVKAIDITIDRVQVFSNTKGWITLSQTPKTFSLLELKAKNQTELLTKLLVPGDIYSQIKLRIARVRVTELNEVKEVRLPSHELIVKANIRVNGNTSSLARFDFIANESLHKTDNGTFIFAPVIKLYHSYDAGIKVGSDNIVVVFSGTVNPVIDAGMDINGETKLNFQIDPKAKLRVNGDKIEIILPPPPEYL